MAIYTLQGPDGRTYEVEGPQGATADQLSQFIGSQSQEPMRIEISGVGPLPPGDPSGQGGDASTLNRFATGVTDPIHGGAQALTHMLPESVVSGVNKATQYINELPIIGPATKALGITPATSAQIDTGIQQREQALQAARQAAGQEGIDWARLGGNVAGTLPMAASLPGATGGMLARTANSIGTSGIMGALAPVTEGDYSEQKGNQVMMSAGLGALAPSVANAVGRVISPRSNEYAKALLAEGVTPTPGQLLGGMAARTEDKLTSVPLLGDMIKNAQGRAREDFNRAAYARALKSINETPSGIVGREGVREVKEALGGAYDKLLPKLQFKADSQFAQEVNNLSQMANNGNIPPEIAKQFDNILKNEVYSRMTKQGAMDGQAFKQLESQLGQKVKSFSSSQNPNDRMLGEALGEVLSSARGALTRSNPQYADELQKINSGYANYTRIRDASSRVGAEEGVFTPAQLAAAVRAGDKSVGKGNYSTGSALMQDLSEAGKQVLGSKVPNSGTVDRALLAGGIGASGIVNPAIPLGVGAAMLPYTKIGQRVTAGALTSRPKGSESLAEALRRGAPGIGAAAYPAIQSNN